MSRDSDGTTALRGAVFDAIPSQLAVLDERGTIVETNQSWRSFGLENGLEIAADMYGENYLEVCRTSNDPTAAAVAEGLAAVLDGRRASFAFEYPCHSPDEQRWFLMRALSFDHAGTDHVLVMHLDITERRLAEMAIEDRNDTLEVLSGVISHDLRNPLTVALAHAELLDDEETAATLVRSLERMNTIIEDALVLANEQGTDSTEDVALDAVVTEAWDQVRSGGASLAVRTERTVTADRSLLVQLFENVLRNAVEHGSANADSPTHRDSEEHGHDSVSIVVGDLEDGFYIADDGPGVPEADQVDVFEAGFTTDKRHGTGLGLSIVQRIVSAHGWDVRVTNSHDDAFDGACFEVTGLDP